MHCPMLSQSNIPSLQLLIEQSKLSTHGGGLPVWQSVCALHVSCPLHHSPSEHRESSAVCVIVFSISLQLSIVHPIPSSIMGAVPAVQSVIGLQVSCPLQYSPSSHRLLYGVCIIWSFSSSQLSIVQLMLSSTFMVFPTQIPAEHWSFCVQ